MAGETANIADVANKISSEIFSWFRWEKIPLMDENFGCHKKEIHKKDGKRSSGTHPVDVVFKYFDSYLNRDIYLNTDLKSYSKSSIGFPQIKSALESLSKTVDCAMGSQEWKMKYAQNSHRYNVRGMLFVYNWDKEYHKEFMPLLKGKRLSEIPLTNDSILHIVEPVRINYLYNVVIDLQRMVSEDHISKDGYSFFYPDLMLHKSHQNSIGNAASIEVLCDPYLIIKHDPVYKYDDKGGVPKKYMHSDEGYIIYYSKDGATDKEFVYLFDVLSRLQILSGRSLIKLRVAHPNPCKDIKSNFNLAKNIYVVDWGLDGHRKSDLDRIDFDVVPTVSANYNPGIIGWKVDD